MGQGNPYRYCQGAGQVRDNRVDAYHQIHPGDECGRISEIMQYIAEIDHRFPPPDLCQICAPFTLLHTEQRNPGDGGERCEIRKLTGAVPEVEFMARFPGPYDTDAQVAGGYCG